MLYHRLYRPPTPETYYYLPTSDCVAIRSSTQKSGAQAADDPWLFLGAMTAFILPLIKVYDLDVIKLIIVRIRNIDQLRLEE